MTSALRLVTLSFWHVHAGEYTEAAINHPDTELVGIWDDDVTRGQAAAEKYQIPLLPDLAAVLNNPEVDGIIVTTETVRHTDIIGRALTAGKHVFTEKLLATSTADCVQLVEAAATTGANLFVCLPRLYHGYTQRIKEILASGRLGDISYARVRLAHAGSSSGWLPQRFFDPQTAVGGALTDLGCHPVYLTQLLLGSTPSTVSATYTDVSHCGVDDNAVVTVGYDNGAIGVIEAGFVHSNSPFTIEVYGTSGGLRYTADQPTIWLQTAQGIEQIELGDDLPHPFHQWVSRIQDGTLDQDNLDRAIALTTLVTTANDAAASGTRLTYPR